MSADQWSVAVYEPNDRFNPHTDYIWVVVDKLSEAAARQVSPGSDQHRAVTRFQGGRVALRRLGDPTVALMRPGVVVVVHVRWT